MVVGVPPMVMVMLLAPSVAAGRYVGRSPRSARVVRDVIEKSACRSRSVGRQSPAWNRLSRSQPWR